MEVLFVLLSSGTVSQQLHHIFHVTHTKGKRDLVEIELGDREKSQYTREVNWVKQT